MPTQSTRGQAGIINTTGPNRLASRSWGCRKLSLIRSSHHSRPTAQSSATPLSIHDSGPIREETTTSLTAAKGSSAFIPPFTNCPDSPMSGRRLASKSFRDEAPRDKPLTSHRCSQNRVANRLNGLTNTLPLTWRVDLDTPGKHVGSRSLDLPPHQDVTKTESPDSPPYAISACSRQ